MKKYQVRPTGDNVTVFTAKNNEINTTCKKEAVVFAKNIAKRFKEVSFNSDTYNNGVCIKNEFGFFENGLIRVYSTTDYKESKKKKKVLKSNISDFFAYDKNGNII